MVRERAVTSLLESWPRDPSVVLIGGYATAAYGPPRYSDDIDFVLRESSRLRIERWLRSKGFDEVTRKGRPARQPFLDAPRFVKPPISLDLLIGRVRDREARVDVGADWILDRPRRIELDLLSGRVGAASYVARPEALWGLKLQAGRPQDLTDLFAMSDEPVRTTEVSTLFRGLMTDSLREKLGKVRVRLGDRKLYSDARSRLALKDGRTTLRRWERFVDLAKECMPEND